MAADSAKLDTVPTVKIDPKGRFKYVLIKISKGGEFKHVVRGFSWAGYHADVYEEFESSLHVKGITCDCLGGGRIEHSPDSKSILVYGYSMGFGKADHSITVDLLKEAYPTYGSITYSNDGY